jgi:hypothetical protein
MKLFFFFGSLIIIVIAIWSMESPTPSKQAMQTENNSIPKAPKGGLLEKGFGD